MPDQVTAVQRKGVRSSAEPPPGTRMARARAGQVALYPVPTRQARLRAEGSTKPAKPKAEPKPEPKAEAKPEAPAKKATRGTPKRR